MAYKKQTTKKQVVTWKTYSMTAANMVARMRELVNDDKPEQAKQLIRDMWKEVYPTEAMPSDKTWHDMGYRIIYRLMYVDAMRMAAEDPRSKGMVSPRILEAYQAADKYELEKMDKIMGNEWDTWHLDGNAPGSKEPRKAPSGKGGTKEKIEALIKQLAKGEVELELGVGTKGETTMKASKVNAGKEVVAHSYKGTDHYDITDPKQRSILAARIWRWSRKEEVWS